MPSTIVDRLCSMLDGTTRKTSAATGHLVPPCELCNNLQKKDADDVRLGFDFTATELSVSAYEKRCPSCLVIMEAVLQSQKLSKEALMRDVRRIYARCCGSRGVHRDTLALEVYFADDRPKLSLEIYSLQSHAWEAVLPRSRVSGHPQSPQALRWVTSLIDHCNAAHDMCRRGRAAPLPKRVLAIESDGHNASYKVRLTEPTDGFSASYAALSHCWGHSRSCLTTRDSFCDRTNGIDWATIPTTFQDAIKMALLLKIKYIWIDSLCIIQDDLEDWNTESAKMADIYQGAYITLSATASSGDAYGCFPPTPQDVDDVEIQLPDDLRAVKVAVRKALIHWDEVTPRAIADRFPLMTRGWAYQERLLSCRVLHFTQAELVWECRSLVTCECNGLSQRSSPGGDFEQALEAGKAEQRANTGHQLQLTQASEDRLITEWIQNATAEKKSGPMRRWKKLSSKDKPQEGRSWRRMEPFAPQLEQSEVCSWFDLFTLTVQEWSTSDADKLAKSLATYLADVRECADYVLRYHRVIEAYSALHLTKRSDRLIALSGICNLIQEFRGNYAAGLWEHSLCFDLLWRVDLLDTATPENSDSTSYHGPSWSWVSVNRAVKYWTDMINFLDTTRLLRFDSQDEHSAQFAWFTATTCFARTSTTASLRIQLASTNPFGTVASAVLTGEASLAPARLVYVRDASGLASTQYKVELGIGYGEVFELAFHADYVLSSHGPEGLVEGAELALLLVHPRVALVLVALHVFGPEPRIPLYRRVGIARFAEDTVRYYKIDWMRGSKVAPFALV